MRNLPGSAGLLLACIGCGPAMSEPEGNVSVQWISDDRSGQATLPGQARLCSETGQVEVLAVRGDTGVGVLLFPADSGSIPAAVYPVFEANRREVLRPGANLALRWFAAISLDAYEGVSGTVDLEPSARGTVSGAVAASLRGVERPDTLHLSGRFDRVPVETAGAGCAAQMSRRGTPR